VQIEENVPLAPFTTLKIGGPARYFARVGCETELQEAIGFARERELPLFVLGGGSNLVVADSGFRGLALQVTIGAEAEIPTTARCRVPAGVDWDRFVRAVCEQGHGGVECLAGIPGNVGGSPVQNIGAYGQEVAQTIRCVRAYDLEAGELVELTAAQCGFAYRRSVFNSTARNRYLVTAVEFELAPQAAPNLSYADLQKHFAGQAQPSTMEVYAAVREIRARKGMLIDPQAPDPNSRSAGSFFKNPVVKPKIVKNIAEMLPPEVAIPQWPTATGEVKLAAAWLIEQAGFPKGFALGRVGISTKHTLALINRTGDASCADLLRLRDLIQTTVEDRFSVSLEQEPVMFGESGSKT
jgi:UDP-N-acetylmuramate dehydrogenase